VCCIFVDNPRKDSQVLARAHTKQVISHFSLQLVSQDSAEELFHCTISPYLDVSRIVFQLWCLRTRIDSQGVVCLLSRWHMMSDFLNSLDIMQGNTCIEGIMGPATFTILNDEVDTVHHAELKPYIQIDRKRLPLLTNIWIALGASESQFLAWILLCSSSHDVLHLNDCLPESAVISSPDGPAYLPTVWRNKKQK
jgi:hypothetical protein